MKDQVCVYTGFMLKVKVETISSLSSVQWHRALHWKLGQNCKCQRRHNIIHYSSTSELHYLVE